MFPIVEEKMNPRNTEYCCPLHGTHYEPGVNPDTGENTIYCKDCFTRWGYGWVEKLRQELVKRIGSIGVKLRETK